MPGVSETGGLVDKVSVIGAGQVGATCANLLVQKDIADVVLVDIVEGLARGKALDIMQSASVLGFSSAIMGTDQFDGISGSEIVVLAAGSARTPGMTRADLLRVNAEVMRSLIQEVVQFAPSSIILVVTNPVDVMAYYVFKKSGFEHTRVIGVSGVLDSARFAYFLAQELDVPIAEIDALVIGAHDDSMLPLAHHSTAEGKAISSLLPPEVLQGLITRTKRGGAEIVSYLKTGSAFYAPGAAAAFVVEIILSDKRETIPVSTLVNGQYDLENVYLGLPCKIGREGIVEQMELELTPKEKAEFTKSAQGVSKSIAALGV